MKGKLIEILGLSPEAEALEIMDRITAGPPGRRSFWKTWANC